MQLKMAVILMKCVCVNAADSFDCLKYLYDHGAKLTKEVATRAAQSGNLECLKFAIENGSGYSKKTPYGIVWGSRNNVECLKYLYSVGCRWKSKFYNYTACRYKIKCFSRCR